MYPTMKDQLVRQMQVLIVRANKIHARNPIEVDMHVKDLEDLKRIYESISHISNTLEKNFYLM